MLESPEYQHQIDFLSNTLMGKSLSSWVFCGGNYVDEYPDFYEVIYNALPLTVSNISHKGDIIYITLGEWYIIIRGDGNWVTDYDEDLDYSLYIDTPTTTIWYHGDPTFVLFTQLRTMLHKTLTSVGPDIMSMDISWNWLNTLKKDKNLTIANLLSNPVRLSGCGSRIRNEIYLYTKLLPSRKIFTLSNPELELLHEALRIVPRLLYNDRMDCVQKYRRYIPTHSKVKTISQKKI